MGLGRPTPTPLGWDKQLVGGMRLLLSALLSISLVGRTGTLDKLVVEDHDLGCSRIPYVFIWHVENYSISVILVAATEVSYLGLLQRPKLRTPNTSPPPLATLVNEARRGKGT